MEFVEKYFADLFGEVEQVGRLEEEADGFRVEALAGLGEDVLDGLFAGEVAVYVGDGDGEAAGRPRDGEAGDAFWESGAVEAFVVGTDGFADGGAGIDEAGECLAVNRVRVEGLPLAFGEAVGVLAEGAEELARDADEAEVAEPGAGREHAAFLFGEVGGLDHLADDFDKGLGLPAEEWIEGREDAGAELEGVFVAFGEALVGRVEGGGLRLQVANFLFEGGVGAFEAVVEEGGFLGELVVVGEQLVAVVGVADGRGELFAQPGFGDEAEDFALVDGLDDGGQREDCGDQDARGIGALLFALGEEVEAEHLGHALVGDDDREGLLGDQFEGLGGAGGGDDGIAVAFEGHFERRQDNGLIIDNEDGQWCGGRGRGGWGCHAGGGVVRSAC